MPSRPCLGAVAVSLLLAMPSAYAARLNPRGVGQVLIYPYYTVNKSQDTLISIVNPTATSKIVQVRIREGYNGRDVLDFALFLSPLDVWTAAISTTSDDGAATIATSDTSCTMPTIPAGGVTFRTAGFDGTGPFPQDEGPDTPARTREGSIEFYVGADIVPLSPTDEAITHVQTGLPNGGVPPGCASLTAASVQPDEATPTGGVYGSGTIVNVGEGTFFGYDATAIEGFTDITLFNPALESLISLDDANSNEATGGVARAYITGSNGEPLALDFPTGHDAVSALFMADTLYDEYIISPELGANTDWVVTFPTKSFYVDKDLYPANATAPFVESFHSPGQSEVATPVTTWDRETGTLGDGGCGFICPGPPPALLYQTNVVTFSTSTTVATGSPSGVLGSTLTPLQVNPFGTAGMAKMDLAGGDSGHVLPFGVDPNDAATTLIGLPAVGFMVYNVINAQAQPGLLANYGGVFPYRTTSSCTGATGSVCAATGSSNPASRASHATNQAIPQEGEQ